MEPKIQKKIIDELKRQIGELIDSNQDSIIGSYEDALDAAKDKGDDDKKFKYSIPLKCAITGLDPESYTVSSAISFAVKRTDERSKQITTKDFFGKPMPDQGGADNMQPPKKKGRPSRKVA